MSARYGAGRSHGLRVALVCPYSFSRPGGVQNHVLGLAGWLLAQGHDPRVLAPGRPDPAALRAAGLEPWRFTSTGRGLPVPYNGSVARVSCGPLTVAVVHRWLRRIRPDVVHVHEPMTPSASLVATLHAEVPVVATFHTATPGSRSMRLAYRVAPGVSARIRGAIAVSEVARRVVHEHGGPEAGVVGNGISMDEHAGDRPTSPSPARIQPGPTAAARAGAVEPAWRGGSHPRITFVGRHQEARKGFDVLLQALPSIRAVHPDVELAVVGPGRRHDDGPVHYLGPLDDRGRNRVLAATDVYVAPNTGRESFGIVLLEAFAQGAPVVASDLPAFREVSSDQHGPVALLAPPGDPQALAATILASLELRDEQRRARARDRAAQFDWQVVGPQVVQRYRQALDPAIPAVVGDREALIT